MSFLTYDTADDIITSLEIIEKLLFPETNFWCNNYLNSEIYFLTGESVKSQITDSISKNLIYSDLESTLQISLCGYKSKYFSLSNTCT